MKKVIWIIGLVSCLGFIGCGDDDNGGGAGNLTKPGHGVAETTKANQLTDTQIKAIVDDANSRMEKALSAKESAASESGSIEEGCERAAAMAASYMPEEGTGGMSREEYCKMAKDQCVEAAKNMPDTGAKEEEPEDTDGGAEEVNYPTTESLDKCEDTTVADIDACVAEEIKEIQAEIDAMSQNSSCDDIKPVSTGADAGSKEQETESACDKLQESCPNFNL